MSSLNKFVITTGDINGIGQEVTFKSLAELKPKKNCLFIVYINKNSRQLSKYKLDHFKIIYLKSFSELKSIEKTLNYNNLIIIKSDLPPTSWVEQSIKLGIKKEINALITAPLSKVESFKTHQVKGHTDLFRKYINNPISMCFIGKYFNVLLLTDHIPLISVPQVINKKLLLKSFVAAAQLAKLKPNLDIALIGLNPHAGENSLIGTEEAKYFIPAMKQFNNNSKTKIIGPLVPDVAFLKNNWNKYSLFISPYHDQGLTAFKLIHGHNLGIQVSLGLPFIRTSVDHGTAKNIFGKNIADHRSMKMAIRYAIKLDSI